MNRFWILFFFSILFLSSCIGSRDKKIENLVKDWNGKDFLFPDNWMQYVIADSIEEYDFNHAQYAVISYVDSSGCIDCRLNLPKWTEFANMLDSVSGYTIPILFIFNPKDKRYLIKLLKRVHFSYPVCIDEEDDFNKLNHFPDDMNFQTFLIDKTHKVIAIGNPILNPGVGNLYVNIIQNKSFIDNNSMRNIKIETQIIVDKSMMTFNTFDWHKEQKTFFTLKNIGNKPLFIQDVTTSCGCTTVTYSREPVQPDKEIVLEVSYKAEHPGHFNKTISVYCNAETSPLVLQINGNAK